MRHGMRVLPETPLNSGRAHCLVWAAMCSWSLWLLCASERGIAHEKCAVPDGLMGHPIVCNAGRKKWGLLWKSTALYTLALAGLGSAAAIREGIRW